MKDADPAPLGSLPGLAVALARQWWPQLAALAAACGIVATTIAGALGVGTALQAGLERLALERLGRIDAAVLGRDFFTGSLAAGLHGDADGPRQVVPAIVMPAVISRPGGGTASVTLLACDDPAALGFEPAPPPLEPDGVLVNGPLAEALGLAAGDPVVLRLPAGSSVPADSPLGRRTGESTGRRVRVAAVLPPRGLGQFSLRPVQATGPLIVTSLADARGILRRDDAANAVFAVDMPAGADAATWIRSHLEPSAADYGLTLEPASEDPPSLRLTSRRLIIPEAADSAAAKVLGPLHARPTLVFLANAITPVPAAGQPAATIPYSTVLGIDDTNLPAGDLIDDAGGLLPLPGAGEIVIDRWMADDLAAQGRPVTVGDELAIAVFEPETVHGAVRETTATLRISGIAAMQGLATARGVVPEVEGITDENSIADWDPPFPFDARRVRTTPPHDEDDRYWKTYGPTPKAFVSLATARDLAGGRFGHSTAWLVPRTADLDPAALAASLASAVPPETLGLQVVSLRAEALSAARGSTPFGSLFLALSSFVVAAGLLLAWLLFGLLVSAHGKDLGLLSAVGFPPRSLARLLLIAGGAAAVVGTVCGTLLGPWWAAGLLAALGRAWNSAVAPGSSLAFEAPAFALRPLVLGGLAAAAISLVALSRAARRAGQLPPQMLLRGGVPRSIGRRGGWLARAVAAGGLAVAGLVATAGRGTTPQEAVGLFFTAGIAALAGLLAIAWLWLWAPPAPRPLRTLATLARRNLGFAPGRAFSVAAIVAAATFLVVAVSSFAQRSPDDPTDRNSPTGGWTEIVTFGVATGIDPADPDTRETLGLSANQDRILAGCKITRLRSSGGEDAACTNLYATLRPTVLGVGPSFVSRGGFRFVTHLPLSGDGPANPWTLLEQPDAAGPIPAVLDQATAEWGLKLGGLGGEFTLPDDAGRPVRFQIVGLLEPGILQGFVLVGERSFERVFPDRSGYALALVDAGGLPAADRPLVAETLTAAWADAVPAVTSARRRLASLQAVQNTFLAGFQALGTLGLLLGTAGVAAVQVQGMLERIGSLAVLRAVGFTLARVRRMLVLETLLMVAIGLAAGATAALIAVAPALASGQAAVPGVWIAATCGLSFAAAVAAATVAATRGVIPARPGAE